MELSTTSNEAMLCLFSLRNSFLSPDKARSFVAPLESISSFFSYLLFKHRIISFFSPYYTRLIFSGKDPVFISLTNSCSLGEFSCTSTTPSAFNTYASASRSTPGIGLGRPLGTNSCATTSHHPDALALLSFVPVDAIPFCYFLIAQWSSILHHCDQPSAKRGIQNYSTRSFPAARAVLTTSITTTLPAYHYSWLSASWVVSVRFRRDFLASQYIHCGLSVLREKNKDRNRSYTDNSSWI